MAFIHAKSMSTHTHTISCENLCTFKPITADPLIVASHNYSYSTFHVPLTTAIMFFCLSMYLRLHSDNSLTA